VAPPERPEPLHGLKVLRTCRARLGRENDPRLVREDEAESIPRPKTTENGGRSLMT
jgi:hypothetical protein